MSRQAASSSRREDGTASVELIAVVPFLLLAVLVAAQIGPAGQALWSAGVAARAGARAALVGAILRRLHAGRYQFAALGAEVSDREAVSVRVVIPRLLPAMPRLTVGAKAARAGWGGVIGIRDDGQATVELVAALPALLLAGLLALQLLATGYALTLADGAAEAGALAWPRAAGGCRRP